MKDHFDQQEIFQTESIITSLQSQGLITSRSDNTTHPKLELSAVYGKGLHVVDRDMSMMALHILLGDMEDEVRALVQHDHNSEATASGKASTATIADIKNDIISVMSEDCNEAKGKGTNNSVRNFRKQSVHFSIPNFAAFFVDNILKQSVSATQNNQRMRELEEKRVHLEKMLNSKWTTPKRKSSWKTS